MRISGIFVVLALALTSAAGAAEPPPERPGASEQPKTVLVLAGGGARGMAHIGVLEVLEELRVPVDAIIGTSMGAIVGGMYASGLSPAEMRVELEKIDWAEAFDDAPARKRLPFRRKEEDRLALAKIEAGFGEEGFMLPAGLVSGQKLNFILRSMLVHTLPISSFDDLAIPFRAIATDLDAGEMVVIDRGDVPQAIRASMAFPVLFTPVRYDGKLLIDGGVVRNMAVDVALEMGAERIIAVDVGSKLQEMTKKNVGAQNVLRRTQSIMSKQSRAEQLELIRAQDILINPELEGISFADFEAVGPAVRAGREAARKDTARLSEMSVPEEEFEAYLARHRAGTDVGKIEITDIEIRGVKRVAPQRILHRIRTRPGNEIDLEGIRRDLEEVYLIGEFETVDFDVEPDGQGYRLIIQVDEKSWGPWYVRAGLTLSSTFKGIGNFTLTGVVRRAEVNRYGAEWRTIVTVGSLDGILTEFYQPLSYASTWFAAPRLSYRRNGDERRYFQDGERLIDSRETVGAFDFGYALGQWGEIRVGAGAGSSKNRPTADTDPNVDRDLGFLEARFQIDRLDDFFFPKTGQALKLDGRWNREALGADDEYDRLEIQFDQAFTHHRNTVMIGTRLGTDFDSNVPFYDDFALGGFLNLSGLKHNALRGDRIAMGRVIYYRRLSSDFSILGTQSYVGASLELGNAWQPGQPTSWDDLLPAGSVFVGVDTLLGPLYLGYGQASTYGGTWYLLFGRAI